MNNRKMIYCVCFCLLVISGLAGTVCADQRIPLINNDFSQWLAPTGDWTMAQKVTLDSGDPRKLTWQAGKGIAVNGPSGRTAHLVSKRSFGDVQAHIEFMVSKGSNSGAYFSGRYEIQVFDSWQQQGPYPGIECGGIYQRWDNNRPAAHRGFEGHSPTFKGAVVNYSLPPGQWQTFDVIFRAPRFDDQGHKILNAAFIKVKHNGKVVHDYVELTGPTRAGLYQDEQPLGPLMLQGDHGPVAYRNIWIEPIDLDACQLPNPFFSYHNGIRPAGDGSVRAQVDLLKQLGYTGTEHSGFKNIKAMLSALDRQSLQLHSIYTPLNLDPQQHAYDPALDQVLPDLKGRRTLLWLHVHGPKTTSMTDQELDQRTVTLLRDLSRGVKAYDVALAIYPHAGFHVEGVDHALRLVKQVDRPNVGITFNLCHHLKVDGAADLFEVLTRAKPFLFSIGINGANSGDAQSMGWDQLIQPLGSGTYDTYAMVKHLTDMGFTGSYGLQCYNIKAAPEVHLQQSMHAWQAIAQRLEADRLLSL
jgi:sugar phosphate isomerase/epimerase